MISDAISIVYDKGVPDKYVKVPEALIDVMGHLQETNYYGSLEINYQNGIITHGKKTESLKFS